MPRNVNNETESSDKKNVVHVNLIDEMNYRKTNKIRYSEVIKNNYIESNNKYLIILGLWESIATFAYNKFKITGGCKIEKETENIRKKSKYLCDLVANLHICRNSIAHCNSNIENKLLTFCETIDDYKTATLQSDLNLLTSGTNIEINAEYIKRVFQIGQEEEEEFVVDMPVSKLDSIKSETVVDVAFDETNIKGLSSL